MKIVRSFSVPVSETIVRERAVTFLTQAGYRQQPDSSGYLHFKRGSNIGALFNFNPQKWACDVHVRIKSEGSSSEINMEAEISTDPTEKRFAEELVTAEFSLLEAAITMNEFKTYNVSWLKKENRCSRLSYRRDICLFHVFYNSRYCRRSVCLY